MCRWSTSTFENSCGCTALNMPERREMTEQIDWQAEQPSQVVSEMLRSLRHYLQAQSQGHHTIDRLEERGVERGSARRFFLERTREGHRQSDEHWNRFKDNAGENSERQGGAHMGFSERIDTILN